MFLGLGLMADPPDPDGPGSGGGPLPGGGAPVGSGSIVLLSMAAAYGARKAYQIKHDKPDYTVIG